MPIDHRRGIYWALGAAFGVVAMIIPWKVANTLGDTKVNTLILLAAAAVFNTALTVVQRRAMPRFRRFDFGFAAALAALTLLGNLASASAIAQLSTALVTVIQRSEIIIVALLAWPLIGERIDRRFLIGAAIAVCGLMVLYDPVASSTPHASGMALAFFSAICFGAMAVLTRKFIQRIQPVSVNALRLWLSVTLWFAFNGVPKALFEISPAQAGCACLAAFCGPFVGRLSLMMSAKYVEARITALAMLTAPPLTLVLAYLLLDELPQVREITGGLLMLLGIAIPILALARPARNTAEQ